MREAIATFLIGVFVGVFLTLKNVPNPTDGYEKINESEHGLMVEHKGKIYILNEIKPTQ